MDAGILDMGKSWEMIQLHCITRAREVHMHFLHLLCQWYCHDYHLEHVSLNLQQGVHSG